MVVIYCSGNLMRAATEGRLYCVAKRPSMTKLVRSSAAAQIASETTRQRALALPEAEATYVPNSPSLAAEANIADDLHVLPDHRTAAAVPPRNPRAVWLLVVWLGVSVATIATAAGVIARYF